MGALGDHSGAMLEILGGYLGILKAPVGISAAILGALGDHLGAMLEILGAILGIFEVRLDEVGFGNRRSGVRIVFYDVFGRSQRQP